MGAGLRQCALNSAEHIASCKAGGWSFVVSTPALFSLGEWKFSCKRIMRTRPSEKNLEFAREVARGAGAPDTEQFSEPIVGTFHINWSESP